MHFKTVESKIIAMEIKGDKEQTFVDDGSLVVFLSGVSAQNKKDVLHSVLIAQLAASAKHNRHTQRDQWYRKYVEVLQNVGWVTQSFGGFSAWDQPLDSPLVEALPKILYGVATETEVKALQQAVGKLETLDPNDERAIIFASSYKGSGGCFQLAVCSQDRDDCVTMTFCSVHFDVKAGETKLLFWRWQPSYSVLVHSRAPQKMTLVYSTYSQARQSVITKLGKKDSLIKSLGS